MRRPLVSIRGVLPFFWGAAMLYFTYITLLNDSDRYGQVGSCGCFGELVHLTPAESFWKNVILFIISLLSLLMWLAWRRPRYTSK